MFHLSEKPRPPSAGVAVTLGQAVDSSAIVRTPGFLCAMMLFRCLKNSIDRDFPAPVTVRDPLARLAAVVAVEHGRDGIHPQPIDVIVLDPFECARDEEPFHLVAAEIVDVSVPVLVEALTRILMFVERRSIEAGETPDVSGKMGRHPIDDHANFRVMTAIDRAANSAARP